jgi:hypothetical protein
MPTAFGRARPISRQLDREAETATARGSEEAASGGDVGEGIGDEDMEWLTGIRSGGCRGRRDSSQPPVARFSAIVSECCVNEARTYTECPGV